MKNLITFIIALFIGISAFAQVKKTNFNGKEYYIYPHSKIARTNKLPASIKTFDDFMVFAEKSFFKEINKNGKALGIKEKEQMNIFMESFMKNLKKQKKQISEFIEVSKKYDGPIYRSSFKLKKDITPSLDSIPDGEYVQLYEAKEFAEEYDTIVVAGKFTIKNNLLEGNAVFYYPSGDTAMFGPYENGMKNGKWTLYERSFRKPPESFAQLEEYQNSPNEDGKIYGTIVQDYKNGSKNGFYSASEDGFITESGYYNNNAKIGEWHYFKEGSDTLLLSYTINRKTPRVFKPIVRKEARMSYSDEFYDSIKHHPNFNLTPFIYFREPHANSYISISPNSIDDYYYDDYYEDKDYVSDDIENSLQETFEAVEAKIEEPHGNANRYFNKWEHLDSVGYFIPFEGKVSAFYPNGQLQFEMTIIDGALKEEPTIYYDNGKVFSEVIYNSDSAYFEEKEYNYLGELSNHFAIDSNGVIRHNLLKNDYVPELLILNGLTHKKYNENDSYYSYYKGDTLDHFGLTGSIIYYQKVNAWDSLINKQKRIDLDSRTRYNVEYKNGSQEDTISYEEAKYAADYTSYNCTGYFYSNNIKIAYKGSLGVVEWFEANDSMAPANLATNDYIFDGDYTKKMLSNGKPFNGELIFIENDKKDTTITTFGKGKIVVEYGMKPEMADHKDEIKELKNELKDKNLPPFRKESLKRRIKRLKKEHGKPPKYGYVYHPIRNDLRAVFPEITNHIDKTDHIVISIKNGKPNGNVTVYNEKQLLSELYFENGVEHGFQKEYAYYTQSKKPKKKRKNNSDLYEALLYEEYGAQSKKGKQIQYLSRTFEYDKGVPINHELYFDKNGKTIGDFPFENGDVHGTAYSHDDFTYVEEHYEYGMKDGMTKVYFKYPNEDSVLIYNLKFENGSLQGKSEIFHKNGRISMEGFFLDNQPIETYNGYDSLGFLIHYVKFDKGFVSEEKIWEENELSARYKYRWEDSVVFNTFDFIENNSFMDEYSSKLNVENYNLYSPYYGRESKVYDQNKNYFLTKYYPTNTVAREGKIIDDEKDSLWSFYRLNEQLNYTIDYADSNLTVDDSLTFKSKGLFINYAENGDTLSMRYVIELTSKYDCANSDHFETRQYYFPMNKYNQEEIGKHVKNFYDSDVLQSEGKYDNNGLPTGIWKFYDPNGRINKVGEYKNGKKHGRWLLGDLSKVKYLGDICLNPNMPNIEEVIEYKEKELEVEVVYYEQGKIINSSSYDINLNED